MGPLRFRRSETRVGCGPTHWWGAARGVFFTCVLVFGGRAAELHWPRIEGEVSGSIEALALPDAPKLTWRITARGVSVDEQVIELRTDGPGTKAAVQVGAGGPGEGDWRILEAEAQLSHWARAIGAQLGTRFLDLVLAGSARVAGEGTWSARRIDGSMYVSVVDGRVELPAENVVLEGLSLEFVMEEIGALRSAPSQMISWKQGVYGELALGPGRLMFTVNGDQVQIDEGVVDVLGGQVNLAAFAFSLRKPEMSFITRAVGLKLGQLLPYLPDFFATAAGEVDGTIMLHWTPDGITFGAGTLSLRENQDATLRLVPTPGLITDRIPAEVLARVPNLKKIETGETTLRAERFEVSFSPEGDQEGRSAVVRLYAEPVDPSYRAPIDLTVNFRGPLERLVRIGTDSRVRMGGNR